MIGVKRIFPECNADTLLVQLILNRGRPAHYKGFGKVIKELVNNDSGAFVIGLVDTDKFKRDSQDPNIHLFSEVVEDKITEEGLKIFRIPNTSKYLIRIHPEFEPWIWRLAEECQIDVTALGFNNYADLEKAAKRNNVSEDRELKTLINRVIQSNPPAIQTLRIWMNKVFPENNI